MIYTIGAQISSYITMGLLVAAILGALVGFIHGLRKTTYRLITFVAFAVIAVLLSQTLIDILFTIEIGDYLSKIPNLPSYVSGNTVIEVATSIANHFVSDTSADATKIILALVSIFVRFAYFALMFTVVRWVYNILTQLLWWIIFKGKKYKSNGKRKSKKRLLGAVLSALKGAAVYCVMCVILLNGPVSLIPQLIAPESQTQKLTTSEEEKVNELLVTIQDIVDNYKQSFMYTAFAGDGENPSINDTFNNFFWSGSYDGYEVNLYQELSTLVDLGLNAFDVYNAFKEDNTIDYQNISLSLKTLANSDLIVDILPIALEAATKMEEITSQLPDSVQLEGLHGINWRDDLDKLGDLVMDLKVVVESVDFGGIFEGELQDKVFDKIDLSGVESDKVEKLFATLASISFVTKAMNIAVSYALTLDTVTSQLGDLEIEMETLVWEDEITDIGSILGRFLDLGIRTKEAVVENLNDTINGLDFGKNDEEGYGKVGDLFTAIFASSFVKQLFPQIMEKVVYPMIPAEYHSLFNFECVNTKGWFAEFEAILDMVKTARGTGSEPELFITNDGQFNTKLLKNITADTILGSELLSSTLLQALVMIKNGELSFGEETEGMIVIPDKFANKDHTAWKNTSINKYIAQEDVVIGERQLEQYNTITIEEYESLDSTLQSKFAPSLKIIGGELYDIVNAFTTLLNVIDIETLDAEALTGILNPENIEKLLESNSKQIDKSNIEVIMESEIISYSLTNVIVGMSEGMVVIPKDDSILLSDEVDSQIKYALKGSEIKALLEAAIKLEIMQSVYVCTNVVVDGLDCYYEGDIISEEVYNRLLESEKEYVTKQTQFNLSFDLMGTLLDKDAGDEYMKLDYILGSEDGEINGSKVLVATLSKFLADEQLAPEIIVVPNSVVTMQVDVDNNAIKVIEDDELRALFTAAIKLEIIKTEYICLDAGTYNGTAYEVDDLISKEVYDLLSDDDKHHFNPIGVIKADVSLLEDLLEEPTGDTYSRLDYVIGSDDNVIHGSKIMHASLSKIVLDAASGGEIIVPNEVIIEDGAHDLIEASELKSVITAVLKLEILEGSSLKVDISILNTLLDTPTDDTYTKLDYIVGSEDGEIKGSKILVATISDKILYQAEGGALIIPNTATTTPTSRILKDSEVRALVTTVIKLGILSSDGNINADLTLLNKMLIEDQTGKSNLDYAIESKIIHATLSQEIIKQNGTIVIPNTALSVEGNCDVIEADELESLVTALIKLDIVGADGSVSADLTLMNTLLDEDESNTSRLEYATRSKVMHATLSKKIIEQDGTIIIPENVVTSEGDCEVIEKSELESLVTALIKLEVIDSEGNMSADITLLNTLLEKPIGDTYTRLEYVVGNKAIKGSDIMNATISDKILQQTTTDTIIVPESSVEYIGTKPVIKGDSLYDLVNSLVKLEIIDDAGNMNADLTLINKMLYVDDNGVRRLDHVINSDIMSLTISKYIVDQSNIISESNALVIPNTMYEEINKYGSSESAYLINEIELKSLLSTIVKLEIVDSEGNMNAGLGIVSSLNSKYTYKPQETVNGVSIDDNYDRIYSIVGNSELNGSIIMRATISKYIYQQKSTMKIFNYVSETHGDVKILQALEMEHLIDAINTMGIINGDNIKDVSSITDGILHNQEWQEKIDNSIILRTTVSSEIIYALYGSDISTVGDAINYICIGNGTGYEVNELISYNQYKALSTENRSKFVKFEEYICISANGEYEVGDAITTRIYNTLTESQKANFQLTEVISEEEMMKLFKALSLLEITDFHHTSVSLNSIFNLTDSELDEVLDSVLMWDAASKSVQNSTTSSDDENVGLLHDMTIEEGIKHRGTDWICKVNGQYNGQNYVVDQRISASAYNALKASDSSVVGKFEQVMEYAYNQELYSILGIERFNRIELVHTLNTFEEIILDKQLANDEFSIQVADLEIIYQQPEKFAKLLTDSILLTYSIKEMMIYSVDHAFSGNTTFNASQKATIIARIDNVNNDMARWKVADESVYPDGNDLASVEYDGQLVKMLKALQSVKELSNLAQFKDKIDDLKSHLYTIDESEVMRFALTELFGKIGASYDETANVEARRTQIDTYVNKMSIILSLG